MNGLKKLSLMKFYQILPLCWLSLTAVCPASSSFETLFLAQISCLDYTDLRVTNFFAAPKVSYHNYKFNPLQQFAVCANNSEISSLLLEQQLANINYTFSGKDFIVYQKEQQHLAPTLSAPELLKARQHSFNDANQILHMFIAKYPNLTASLESAAGYGVFSTTSFNAVLYAGGWGSGMVFDNVKQDVIYVDALRAGTGLGLGYISENILIIFHKHYAIEQYFGVGGGMGGDVAASGTAGIWSKSVSFNPAISTYRLYDYGANLQLNWGATVYWLSPLLN